MSFKPHSKQEIFVTAPFFRHVAGIAGAHPLTSPEEAEGCVPYIHVYKVRLI